HEEIASESPPPYPNTLVAWNEMIRALWRQRREPSYSVHRPVPVRSGGPPAAAAESPAILAEPGAS
ncbi:MAG: fatty acid desaturase, partial [Solirubrobacteraceae bacterium]